MCMHCETGSELIAADLVPGFDVHRAKRDGHAWPAGHFGVTWKDHYSPEPVFIFELFPGEIEILDGIEYPKGSVEAAAHFRDSVEVGYAFVKACMESGYTEKDLHPGLWFVRKILERL